MKMLRHGCRSWLVMRGWQAVAGGGQVAVRRVQGRVGHPTPGTLLQPRRGMANEGSAPLFSMVPGEGQLRITSFGTGGITVEGMQHKGGLVLLPKKVLTWQLASVADLAAPGALSALYSVSPPIDILVLGTGRHLQPVPNAVREKLRERGIALEVQDTRHACATYNFLLEEGRVVGAALLPMTAS